MPHIFLRLALLALVLLYPAAQGCSDSSRDKPTAPFPDPQALNDLSTWDYRAVPAPVTSAVPHEVTVWAVGPLVDYSTRPGGIHPSVRLTRSVLRPGEDNTPLQRLLEEVVLTRPEADSRISPHVAGPPPGWQVVAMVGRVLLNVDTSTTPHTLTEAEGLTDVTRRVIFVRATDDAVTPEGSPLMPALAHELRHAIVFEEALARGLTPDQAARESKAIDPTTTTTPSP